MPARTSHLIAGLMICSSCAEPSLPAVAPVNEPASPSPATMPSMNDMRMAQMEYAVADAAVKQKNFTEARSHAAKACERAKAHQTAMCVWESQTREYGRRTGNQELAMFQVCDSSIRFAERHCATLDGKISAAERNDGPTASQAVANTALPSPSAGQPTPLAPVTGAEARHVVATPQPTAWALVVGIERYRDAPAATGARADAERFARVLENTYGIKPERMRLALDDRATKTDMESHLAWLKAEVPAGARIYFFFSGHGAPEAANGTPFLLPYDGNPDSVSRSALPLSDVLNSLAGSRARDVLAFVDSCFSGAGGRSVLPKGARPLVRVKDPSTSAQIALMTASQGAEISGPAPDEPLGLFTRHLTEGLGTGSADSDGDGQVSLSELQEYVKPRVIRDARKAQRNQTPSLVVGRGLGDAGSVAVGWGYPRR